MYDMLNSNNLTRGVKKALTFRSVQQRKHCEYGDKEEDNNLNDVENLTS